MLSRSQRIAATFGRTYILAAAGNGRFEIIHAHFFSGMYWLLDKNLRDHWHPLRKHQMAKSSLELVDSVKEYSDGSILTKCWVPLSEKMQAFYDMMPDLTDPTGPTDPQMPG